VLLVLLAASALVFIIACSNVANLILTRTVRREASWPSAALGASTGALRRMLLAEGLCSAARRHGRCMERPAAGAILARYASRFSSVRSI